MKTAFLYTGKYLDHHYGANHPLKVERLGLTYELCRAYGLFELQDSEFIETRPATESEILRFHTPQYVEFLKRASEGEIVWGSSHGLGPGDNPVFPGLWEWSLLHAGASLQCARLISEGEARITFNIAGGLHHARADRASGFCYVNDPVLAILHFLEHDCRVLYLDIDAHHGDGVQWAFYDHPRVLTVSFHQDGSTLFPGTGSVEETGKGDGAGYSINVPMLPGTDDTVFLDGFFAVIPRLLERYKPGVVVSQLGVDSFRGDPLAALELTTNGFCQAVHYLVRQAPALVALGGGGYNIANVARAWTLAWAIMNGVELPEGLPESMIHSISAGGTQGTRLRDPVHKSASHEKCARHVEDCVTYLESKVIPGIHSNH